MGSSEGTGEVPRGPTLGTLVPREGKGGARAPVELSDQPSRARGSLASALT